MTEATERPATGTTETPPQKAEGGPGWQQAWAHRMADVTRTSTHRMADVTKTSVNVTRQVLPAKGGVPLYAGLAGLAALGVLEWPVAAAAGLGYAGYAALHPSKRQQATPQAQPTPTAQPGGDGQTESATQK